MKRAYSSPSAAPVGDETSGISMDQAHIMIEAKTTTPASAMFELQSIETADEAYKKYLLKGFIRANCNCSRCAEHRLKEWQRRARDARFYLVVGAITIVSFIIAYIFW